jgi:competence protein ComEC
LAVAVLLLILGAALAAGEGGGRAATLTGLRVSVLDVGQGDAILLQPASAPPVLVDTGPPGDRIAGLLEDAELLASTPVDRVLYGALGREPLLLAREAGARPERIAAGTMIDSGRLRVEVLWPPPERLSEPHPEEDPNQLAVVALARWGGFSILLTADAEAESVPLDPGPIDVLKIAHHGSDDAGLGPLLDRTRPRLAVISVGADNPFGHPTPGTLATLAEHHVPVLRTDLEGTISLDIGPGAGKEGRPPNGRILRASNASESGRGTPLPSIHSSHDLGDGTSLSDQRHGYGQDRSDQGTAAGARRARGRSGGAGDVRTARGLGLP